MISIDGYLVEGKKRLTKFSLNMSRGRLFIRLVDVLLLMIRSRIKITHPVSTLSLIHISWSKTLRQWMPHIMALLMSPLASAQAQTINIPVQVYLYRFAASPALDSSLSEGQVLSLIHI